MIIIHENIYCGYSLEAPCRGISNEYPQLIMLSWRNKKKTTVYRNFQLIKSYCDCFFCISADLSLKLNLSIKYLRRWSIIQYLLYSSLAYHADLVTLTKMPFSALSDDVHHLLKSILWIMHIGEQFSIPNTIFIIQSNTYGYRQEAVA